MFLFIKRKFLLLIDFSIIIDSDTFSVAPSIINDNKNFHSIFWNFWLKLSKSSIMEQHTLDTNAGKQLSYAATDVKLRLVLKK